MPDPVNEFGIPIRKKGVSPMEAAAASRQQPAANVGGEELNEFGIPIRKRGSEVVAPTVEAEEEVAVAPDPPPRRKSNTPLEGSGELGDKLGFQKYAAPVVTIGGTKVPVKSLPGPLATDTKTYAKGLQERINSKTFTQEDVAVVAKGMKNTIPEVAAAYMNGRPDVGKILHADHEESQKKQRLAETIARTNAKLGRSDDPSKILASAESTGEYLANIEKIYNEQNEWNPNEGEEYIPLVSTVVSGALTVANKFFPSDDKKAHDQKVLKNNQELGEIKSLMVDNIRKKIHNDNTLKYDEKVREMYRLTNGGKMKLAEEAVAERLRPFSNLVNEGMSRLGMSESTAKQVDVLNAFKADIEFDLNDEVGKDLDYTTAMLIKLTKDAEDITAQGGDASSVAAQIGQLTTKRNELAQNYKDEAELYKKYPVKHKQRVIAVLNDYNAKKSGNIEGYDASQMDNVSKAEYLRNHGISPFDPIVHDVETDDLTKDYTKFGKLRNEIANVAIGQARSIGDIVGVRDKLDRLSEKTSDELFPTSVGENDEFQLKGWVKNTQTIGKTTAQVLAQGLLQRVGMRVGRLGGMTEAAAATGAMWTTGALSSYDSALKDSYDFIDNAAGRVAYAGLNAIFTAWSEKWFDESKVIPSGVTDMFKSIAGKVGRGEMTEALGKELLGKVMNQAVRFGKHYVKNTGQEVAEEGGTQLFGDLTRFLAGDNSMNVDKATDNVVDVAIQTALGTSVIAGFGARADMRRERNMSHKSTLYNSAIYHDRAEDAINLGFKEGLYSEDERNDKLKILNTARTANGILKETEKVTGKELKRPQRELYVANLTAESMFTAQLKETTDPLLQASITDKINALQEQRKGILSGEVQIDENGDFVNPSAETKSTDELAQINKNRQLDNKDIDDKIIALDVDSPTYQVQKDNLEKERVEINDYYDTQTDAVKNPRIPTTSSEPVASESETETTSTDTTTGTDTDTTEGATSAPLNEEEKKSWGELTMAEKLKLAKENLPEVDKLSNREVVDVADQNAKRLLDKMKGIEPEAAPTETRKLTPPKLETNAVQEPSATPVGTQQSGDQSTGGQSQSQGVGQGNQGQTTPAQGQENTQAPQVIPFTDETRKQAVAKLTAKEKIEHNKAKKAGNGDAYLQSKQPNTAAPAVEVKDDTLKPLETRSKKEIEVQEKAEAVWTAADKRIKDATTDADFKKLAGDYGIGFKKGMFAGKLSAAQKEQIRKSVSKRIQDDFDAATKPVSKKGKRISLSNLADLANGSVKSDNKKVIGAIKNIIKSLDRISPNTKTFVYETREAYEAAYRDLSRDEDGEPGQGMFTSDNEIHIDLTTANTTTAFHEAAHAVMASVLKDSETVLDTFYNQIRNTVSVQEEASLDSFARGYPAEQQKDEFVTEFLARVASGQIDLKAPSVLDKVSAILNKLAKAVGVDLNLKTESEVSEFARKLSTALRTGESMDELSFSEEDAPTFDGPRVKLSRSPEQAAALSEKTQSLVKPGAELPSMVLIASKDKKKVTAYSGVTNMDALKVHKREMYINRAIQLAKSSLVPGKTRMFNSNVTKDKEMSWAAGVYEKARETVVSNLLHLYDNIPAEVRSISKLWYDGANKIAHEFAREYNITAEQSAGIIASLSPQKPWFDNLHIAQALIDFHTNNQDTPFPQEAFDFYKLTGAKYPKQVKHFADLQALVGVPYKDLPLYDKAVFIRFNFDSTLDRKAPLRLPTGEIVGRMKSKSSYSGYDKIANGVSIMVNGSPSNISKNIGKDSKVRNFYNNIINPQSSEYATIDTHAIAAGYHLPLGSNSPEVNFDFATFAFFLDAYAEAARQRGVLPREMQSVVWEGVKSLFPPKKKRESDKKFARDLWGQFKDGSLSLEDVQAKIRAKGEDLAITDWSGLIDSSTGEGRPESYVSRLSLSGGNRSADRQGDSGGAGSGVPGVGEGDKISPKRKVKSSRISTTQFAMGYAPFREGDIKTLSDSDRAFENKKYKQWLDMTTQFAEDLGITVTSVSPTVGIYGATSGNMEASAKVLLEATPKQARALAALMGTLAPDLQHSVMLNEYSESGVDTELLVKFRDAAALQAFIADREAFGVKDLAVDPATLTATILDIPSQGAIFDRDKFLNSYGSRTESIESSGINTSFIGEGEYGGIVQEARDSLQGQDQGDAGKNLDNAYQLATKRLQRQSGNRAALSQQAKEKLNSRLFKTVTDYVDKFKGEFGLTQPLSLGEVVPFSEETSREISDAYNILAVDNSADPEVKAAYDQLVKEVDAQYDYLINEVGLDVEFMENDPYDDSIHMLWDVYENNHLKVFKGGEPHAFLDAKDANGLSANEKFRAVHDYFGHAVEGNQFGKKGEEGAWVAHSQMFSPLAQRAMSTETRGQNSWVNNSPVNKTALTKFAEGNKLLSKGRVTEGQAMIKEAQGEFQFADQKVDLLPVRLTTVKSSRMVAEEKVADKVYAATSKGELKLDFVPNETIALRDEVNPRRTYATQKRIQGQLDALNQLIKCR